MIQKDKSDLFFDLDKLEKLDVRRDYIWDRNESGERMPIDKPYAYHKPSPDGLEKINKLRAHFSEGERLIKEVCPISRHQSVALTNNETTAMWAIKAVVFNDPNSEVE